MRLVTAVWTVGVMFALIVAVLLGTTPATAVARSTLHALREQFCPATFPGPMDIPQRTRVGTLVPWEATGAIVCTYLPDPDRDAAPLTGALRLKRPLGELVSLLNFLPVGPPAPVPDPVTGDIPLALCAWLTPQAYALVFILSDGSPPVIVWDYPDCGVVARDGDVRYDQGLTASRKYW